MEFFVILGVTTKAFTVVGIATATWITYILNFAIGVIYITLNKSVVKEGSWHWINKDSFTGIVEYLRYGIPSMVMIILESWWFEGLIIMSGFLGVDQLGASVITLNFQGIIYLVSLGGSISTSSLIGNSLGASNPENAKKYTNMGVILSLILSVITTLVFGLFSNQIISIFTNHEEIKSIAKDTIPLLLVILWGDYISLISGGMITAMGYQSYAIIYSVICFWVLIL